LPVSPNKTSWIEIALVDQDGQPVSGEQYQITLPDGSTMSGTTDGDGMARVDGIDPGTCQITFPNIDKNYWHKQ
jgi:type VI secretion system secreted protein VgrG